MKVNILKKALEEGKTVFGPFCKMLDPTVVELAALAGFDFVIIDMEHGPYSIETVQQMVRAAEARGISAVVRVPENSETSILRVSGYWRQICPGPSNFHCRRCGEGGQFFFVLS